MTSTTEQQPAPPSSEPQQKAAADQKGGIAWGGSLVGSKNPHNLGYRYSHPHKRFRAANDQEAENPSNLPSNVVVQFQNRQGEELANQLDLPTNSSVDDLNALLHTLLHPEAEEEEESSKRIPYTFYAKLPNKTNHNLTDDVEITSSLASFLQTYGVSTEATLQITYHPLAVFRVRPVTRCTDTLPGHTEAVLHVSYAPHGKHLASGGGDTTVRFWDVHTNLPKFTCRLHKDHVLCTAWSPCGTQFASVDKRGVLILWNPLTGESMGSPLQAHKQWITSMAWEPLHASRDGVCERLVTASKDGTAKVWNTRTRKCLNTLSGHVDSIEAVKWGGEYLMYTASRDRTIKVWNAQHDPNQLGKLVRTLKGHGHRINTLALSSDYICRTGPFDPEHNNKGKVPTSKPELWTLAKERYQNFAQTTCPQETLVSGSDDYTLFVWHPVTSKHPLKRLTGHQNLINHIQFSPDGRFFASASFDKKIKIWNGASGEFVMTLTGHVGAVYQVAWSADSQYLVSASADSTAKLWNLRKSKQAQETLPGHEDQVFALDWSPTGGSVATGSKDRTIKIWKH